MKKLLLIILIGFLHRSNAQICFNPAISNAVGAYPWDVCAADFNHDGFIDIAVSGDNIYVALGTGTGTFGSTQTFTTGYSERGLISADFNMDGNQDLAADNGAGGGTLSILLGNGTGGFGPSTTFTFNGSNSEDLVSGDFNEDGFPDLALTNHGGANITVMLGNGVGGFGPDTSFYIAGNSMSILTSDFNTDGHLDIAATTNNNFGTIAIMLGTGTGTFANAIHYDVGSLLGDNPWSLHSADFNGDGKLDLVCTNNSDSISVLLGTGAGIFGPKQCFYSGVQPYRLAVSDFNGDSKTDIAVANLSSITILLGNGNGVFVYSSNIVGDTIQSIISSDINGDSRMDLAYVRSVSNASASVLLNCTPTPTCIASVTDSLFNISPLNWGILPHYSAQVTSALWYWGDGTSTTGLYPSHTYTTAGWYNICVTVYTSCGDSTTTCRNDSIYRTASNSSMVNVNVVSSTNGINQIAKNKNVVSIYPNPFSDNLTLNLNSSAEAAFTYTMNDMYGNQIMSEKSIANKGENKVQINTTSLSSGVYFVTV